MTDGTIFDTSIVKRGNQISLNLNWNRSNQSIQTYKCVNITYLQTDFIWFTDKIRKWISVQIKKVTSL